MKGSSWGAVGARCMLDKCGEGETPVIHTPTTHYIFLIESYLYSRRVCE